MNGLRVATEDNFLFSYDITSLTAPLRRALNRERSNVGRTAYADRDKARGSIATLWRRPESPLHGIIGSVIQQYTRQSDMASHVALFGGFALALIAIAVGVLIGRVIEAIAVPGLPGRSRPPSRCSSSGRRSPS